MPFRVGANRIGSIKNGNDTIGSAFLGYTRVFGAGEDRTQVIASGGVITDVGGYRYHTFTLSAGTTSGTGSFSVTNGGIVDALIIAGGGGGGKGDATGKYGGGGGAGGVVVLSDFAVTPITYEVLVGDGGNGATVAGTPGTNGENSSLFDYISLGGGYGGTEYTPNRVGNNGGSGGGGAWVDPTGYAGGVELQSTSSWGGLGFDGGSGNVTAAGGGGGASEAGNTDGQGHGGDGYTWVDGNTYAGGGAGGWNSTPALPGGTGGGGDGGYRPSFPASPVPGQPGTDDTGAGGGGGGNRDAAGQDAGGDGGSGIVIIRYPISA